MIIPSIVTFCQDYIISVVYVLVPQPHVQLSATAIALIVVSVLITFVVPLLDIYLGKREGKVSYIAGLHEVSAPISMYYNYSYSSNKQLAIMAYVMGT